MFEITLVFVPPGGGEADYSLRMMVPAVPREGDYITVLRSRNAAPPEEHSGTEDFIVRRVWWQFDFPDDGKAVHEAGKDPVGSVTMIGIECEFAQGAYSSPAHRRACGENAKSFEASAY